jgi:hypothetical protein
MEPVLEAMPVERDRPELRRKCFFELRKQPS